MFLTRVSWHLSEGIRALAHMLNMLYEVAIACKVSAKRSSGWEYSGINLEGEKYWIGLIYNDPEKLWFTTRCWIDPEAAAKLGEGELNEEKWVPGRYRWRRCAELSSESVHFFARSKVGQMRWLMDYLRECLTMARSIETPDQPPIPEEPEES